MELYVEEWRIYRGLTQEALAVKADVDESTVIRAEKSRKARVTTVQRLAAALGVTTEQLYDHPPVKKTETEITLEEAMKGIKRFMAHGDLTLEDLLAELLTVRAERKKRGLE